MLKYDDILRFSLHWYRQSNFVVAMRSLLLTVPYSLPFLNRVGEREKTEMVGGGMMALFQDVFRPFVFFSEKKTGTWPVHHFTCVCNTFSLNTPGSSPGRS